MIERVISLRSEREGHMLAESHALAQRDIHIEEVWAVDAITSSAPKSGRKPRDCCTWSELRGAEAGRVDGIGAAAWKTGQRRRKDRSRSAVVISRQSSQRGTI